MDRVDEAAVVAMVEEIVEVAAAEAAMAVVIE